MPSFAAAGLAALTDVIDAAVESGAVPGAVCAVGCGDEVHVVAAGQATVGGPAMTPSTLFRIASLTKPLTAACVLSLVGDGSLALDEPVERRLPELADRRVLVRPDAELDETVPARRSITVRDLLTFTWGFGLQPESFGADPAWPLVAAAEPLHTLGLIDPADTPDPDSWIARLGELPLFAQPGASWLYSSGSDVLGVLALRATGRPFDEVLRERVLAPLGMADTAFWTADTERLATAYRRRDGVLQVADPPTGPWSAPPAFPAGSGGLLATATDVLAFGRALLRHGGAVLPPVLAAELTRDQLTASQRRSRSAAAFLVDRTWGYGVSVLPDRYGWEGGTGTSWCNVPSLDLTVVTLTQREFDETGAPPVLEAAVAAARDAVRT